VEILNPSGDLIRYKYDGAGNRLRREAVIGGGDLDRGQTIAVEEVIRLVLERVGPTSPTPDKEEKATGRDRAPGQQKQKGKDRETGPDDPPGRDRDDKLTGRENALTRGRGLKIGLRRQFEEDDEDVAGEVIFLLERIVNGETRVPAGDGGGLEAVVREVADGYTIVGLEFTYNSLGQLASAHNLILDETITYAWDAAGGLSHTENATLVWDEQRRLAGIAWADGWSITFTYDAQGRRLARTVSGPGGANPRTTAFHYVPGTRLVLYEEGPDGLRLDYTYDPEGRRLTVTYQGRTYWYVYSGRGDVVALIGAEGRLVARYEYDDQGRVVRMAGPDGLEVRDHETRYLSGQLTAGEPTAGLPADPDHAIVLLNPYRYAGYRYDRETDLYFLETRYYDPWAARFISRDDYPGQVDRPLTLNRYVYALNNPINYVDPTGRSAVAVPLLGLGGAKWLLPVFAVPGAGQVLMAGAAVAIAVIATVGVARTVTQEAPVLPLDWERERDKIIERIRNAVEAAQQGDIVSVPLPRRMVSSLTLLVAASPTLRVAPVGGHFSPQFHPVVPVALA
jgi:RHS repeat-associated protein